MFFQLNLGGKKKTSGKCVSFNRRLSVKRERSSIYSCFPVLDVTRLSNVACSPSNVSFLLGTSRQIMVPQAGGPWSCLRLCVLFWWQLAAAPSTLR